MIHLDFFKVMDSLHAAENQKRAKPTEMFEDLYDVMPAHLQKQKQEMLEHIKLYKKEYPLELFEKL